MSKPHRETWQSKDSLRSDARCKRSEKDRYEIHFSLMVVLKVKTVRIEVITHHFLNAPLYYQSLSFMEKLNPSFWENKTKFIKDRGWVWKGEVPTNVTGDRESAQSTNCLIVCYSCWNNVFKVTSYILKS